MKYCPKCGTETESKFCPNCGTPMKEKRPRCPRCGTEADSRFCPNCGSAMSASAAPAGARPASYGSGSGTYRASAAQAADPGSYKLGWHKFLIYFALWCAGVLDILNGVSSVRSAKELMNYSMYSSYGAMFLILGVLTIALGGFIIYVRFQLARFRSGAPTKLLIANAVTLTVNLISQLIASFILPDTTGAEVIAGAAGSLVFLIICWKYYSNRAELFVN